MDTGALTDRLSRYPPFDRLDTQRLAELAGRARTVEYRAGERMLDAFAGPVRNVLVVLDGRADLWIAPVQATGSKTGADTTVGPGALIGVTSMLAERQLGPRAAAATDLRAAAIPVSALVGAFASLGGARYLAAHVPTFPRPVPPLVAYTTVDDLILREPLVVPAGISAAEVATRMSRLDAPCAAVRLPAGGYAMVTDALIRRALADDGALPNAPVESIADRNPPTVVLGDSAAEALVLLLDRSADFVLVTDRTGELRGVVAPRDFMVSPTAVGISLHEQVRRAATVDDLCQRARRLPSVLDDLLARGLTASKVIGVHSAIIDTVVRRAITLVFEHHPSLSVDAFTWLALGSNGRHEAVLSSDVDSAASFDDAVDTAEIAAYRAAFAEVADILDGARLYRDRRGTSAQNPLFARTNAQWRAAALEWMATPDRNNGAIMTSLLVDGRPIHGDPGLSAVDRVFADVRFHPGTMRLLLQEMLSRRAKPHALREALRIRPELLDIKADGLLPLVNLGRWAALSVGSAALPTVERLRAAAGSEMLPEDRAATLIEVFGELQRLRLRYQLMQWEAGETPTDLLVMERVSPIDRSILIQAIREVAAAQRRMDNIAVYVPVDEWATRQGAGS
jgi:CBS domain-containing protein